MRDQHDRTEDDIPYNQAQQLMEVVIAVHTLRMNNAYELAKKLQLRKERNAWISLRENLDPHDKQSIKAAIESAQEFLWREEVK